MKKPVLLMWLHGLYFILPSIWPFVHMPSFLAVTGPKTDLWLVKTVAVLLLVIGTVLITAAIRKEYQFSLGVLAVSSAAGMAVIDIYYATNDVIWDTYLLDAIAEILLLSAWLIYFYKSK